MSVCTLSQKGAGKRTRGLAGAWPGACLCTEKYIFRELAKLCSRAKSTLQVIDFNQ